MTTPPRPLLLAALACVWLAAACESAPPPAPERVVAPPDATSIVTPPPKELSICQRGAKPTSGGDAATVASFEAFSQMWVKKMRDIANAKASATSRTTIRDTFEMELRPTSSAQAPYVGVLTYCEIGNSCTSLAPHTCKPRTSTVVKEMFRFQAGKWVY
ncbi:MAG: hypothetical protein FJ091_03955 [Deltaproteobacteria bacterium]|nr:hypothetical protein [Deltaproteobacteria bacterium]